MPTLRSLASPRPTSLVALPLGHMRRSWRRASGWCSLSAKLSSAGRWWALQAHNHIPTHCPAKPSHWEADGQVVECYPTYPAWRPAASTWAAVGPGKQSQHAWGPSWWWGGSSKRYPWHPVPCGPRRQQPRVSPYPMPTSRGSRRGIKVPEPSSQHAKNYPSSGTSWIPPLSDTHTTPTKPKNTSAMWLRLHKTRQHISCTWSYWGISQTWPPNTICHCIVGATWGLLMKTSQQGHTPLQQAGKAQHAQQTTYLESLQHYQWSSRRTRRQISDWWGQQQDRQSSLRVSPLSPTSLPHSSQAATGDTHTRKWAPCCPLRSFPDLRLNSEELRWVGGEVLPVPLRC